MMKPYPRMEEHVPFPVAALLRKQDLRITELRDVFLSYKQRLIAEREPPAFLKCLHAHPFMLDISSSSYVGLFFLLGVISGANFLSTSTRFAYHLTILL